MKKIFDNHRIQHSKRVLNPFFSAVISFFVPGAAQALNGQVVKGSAILLGWYALMSVAQTNERLYGVMKILQYVIMFLASSDAYFIASRMQLGEDVRNWSVLFYKMETPAQDRGFSAAKGMGRATLIKGAEIYDGTGGPRFRADVLLEGGIIRYIRPYLEEKESYTVIRGEHTALLPGIVNPCSLSEGYVFRDNEDTGALRQGITTEILGQNGFSLAPVKGGHSSLMEEQWIQAHGTVECAGTFDNTGLYLMELEKGAFPVRLESMAGYGTLRTLIKGEKNEALTDDEMERVMNRVRSGMESGTRGVSFDAARAPMRFATDGEIAGLLAAAAEFRKIVHIRLPVEREDFFSAVRRFADAALNSGAAVTFTDVHIAGGTAADAETLAELIEGYRVRCADIGITVSCIERTRTPDGVVDTHDMPFMQALIRCPFTSFGISDRDDGPSLRSLPLYLGSLLKKDGSLPEEAVSRCTMRQAARYGLYDRGIIREGMTADLVMLRPDRLPCADGEESHITGIARVFVGGRLSYDSEAAFDNSMVKEPRILGLRRG